MVFLVGLGCLCGGLSNPIVDGVEANIGIYNHDVATAAISQSMTTNFWLAITGVLLTSISGTMLLVARQRPRGRYVVQKQEIDTVPYFQDLRNPRPPATISSIIFDGEQFRWQMKENSRAFIAQLHD